MRKGNAINLIFGITIILLFAACSNKEPVATIPTEATQYSGHIYMYGELHSVQKL